MAYVFSVALHFLSCFPLLILARISTGEKMGHTLAILSAISAAPFVFVFCQNRETSKRIERDRKERAGPSACQLYVNARDVRIAESRPKNDQENLVFKSLFSKQNISRLCMCLVGQIIKDKTGNCSSRFVGIRELDAPRGIYTVFYRQSGGTTC
jgi:hypothetical protein